jgi:hypothetical protein
MRTPADLARFIAARPGMMRLLATVERQALRDAWIGAGFVRNAVWDELTGRRTIAALDDVDVVHFDPDDPSQEEHDAAIEGKLRDLCPETPWSVKNQARMHVRNGDRPYRDVADAMARWPETATAVAARSREGHVEILAPHGIDDLVGLVVRPTPAFLTKLDVYRARVRGKNWQARWPGLIVLGHD